MGNRWTGKSCRLSTMMIMTSVFFLVEIIVGYVTNSIALVADSFHMLSDLVALVVGLASVKISKKKTKGNTYGWQRAEVLGALINCVFLLALCFSISVESLKRLVEMEQVESPIMMLAVGGLGLLVNVLGLGLFGGHGHSHGGSHGHSHGGKGHGHGHNHDEGQQHLEKFEIVKEKDQYEKKCVSNGHHRSHYDHEMTNGDLAETKCLVNGVNDAIILTTPTSTTTIATSTTSANGIDHNNTCSHNSTIMMKNGSAHRESSKDVHNDKEVYTIGDNIEIEIEKSDTSASMNMRGVFLHVLGDALGSVVVIVSGLAIWLVEGQWKYYLDPILSLIIVGIILFTTIPLFRETSSILLQAVPQDVCVDGITRQLLEIEGVQGVHECHIWQLSGQRIIASAHVHCKDLQDYMSLASKIKDVFHKAGIHSTTIQPEVDKLGDCSVCSIQCPMKGGKSCVEKTCCKGKSLST